jgi:hypothetical protein
MVTLVVSFGYTVTAFELPLGAASRPGAGMFPRAVGLLAVLISLWLVVESAVGRSEPEAVDLPDGERRRLVLIFLVGTISLMVLLPVLGQYLAGAIYSAVMAATLGTWPWWKGVLVGVAVSCGIAWAFINLLQVPLPAGNIFHA